jgi:branched-chain amino acid transport system permease protein
MPFAPKPGSARVIATKTVAVGVVAVILLTTLSAPWRLGITTTAISAVLAMSLVVVTGYVGQISLAQLALAGAAGFALSKVTLHGALPFPLGPIVAVLFATAIGIVISVASIRIRGVDLAIVTLALATAAETIVFNNPAFAGSSFGATVVPPALGAAHFGPGDPTAWKLIGYDGDGKIPNPWFGVFCVVVALLMAVLVLNFRRSGSGRVSLAVRSNERATAAAGVSVTRVKMVAFTVGSFLAGTGGVLAGYSNGAVSTSTFSAFACITLLVYAYLGGISSVGGAFATGCLAAGGLGAVAMTEWLHLDSSYLLLLGGVGLVLTVVLNPEGIAGESRRFWQAVGARLLPRRVESPPENRLRDGGEVPDPGLIEPERVPSMVPAAVEEAQPSGTTA